MFGILATEDRYRQGWFSRTGTAGQLYLEFFTEILCIEGSVCGWPVTLAIRLTQIRANPGSFQKTSPVVFWLFRLEHRDHGPYFRILGHVAQCMAISRGAEELYLQEARLERQYKDCEPLLKSISTIISSKPTNDAEALSEPSKRAVRRLCGFWDRVVLLHQNGQLRSDFFAPESPWRERGRSFRQLMEPLDIKIMQQEGQLRRSNSGGGMHRPERYKFLEDQEINGSPRWRSGESATIKELLAERRAALRGIDVEALQARAASLSNRPGPAAAAGAGLRCRAASLGTGNAAAFDRVSCHDRAAAQLQSQLAAEAAAFISARALHHTTKERLIKVHDNASTELSAVAKPAATPEIPAAAPAAQGRTEQEPPPPSRRGLQRSNSALAVVKECPTEQEASQAPESPKANENDCPVPPAVSLAQPSPVRTRGDSARRPEPVTTPPNPKTVYPQKAAAAIPSASLPAQPVSASVPAKRVWAAETPQAISDAGPSTPVEEQAPEASLEPPLTPAKAPELASALSWAPTTPDQSMEALPTSIKPDWVQNNLAKTPSQEGQPLKNTGDAVWEAEGVIPLVTMLSLADSTHAIAAASAIGQLASANNKAFQIGVGEAGGLKKLLGMAQSDYPMAAAAAAKALGGLVTRSRVMQESLLGAEGATVIVQLLDTKAGKSFQKEGSGREDSAQHRRPASNGQDKMQLLRVSLTQQDAWEKQAAAAVALSSFVQGFGPGHKEVMRVGGIPKLVALLGSSSETVKERAIEALLAVVGKDASNQSRLRESGGVPSVLSVMQGAGGAAHSRAAEHAGALLYRLTFYQTAHADLQAAGCIQALVPLLQSGDARLKRHAVWAIQNLTAGGPETEEAICAAGGVPALLSLIRSCIEEPEQATLLEPATVALLNLAAGSDAHKEAIVEADALPVLVKLLTHQGQMAGHAARALWNLTSKHTANQDAVREAGAIPPLVDLLAAPNTIKGSKNGAVPAQEEASGALGSLARGHPPNQDAVRAAGAIARLISLVTSGTPAVRGQAAWALQALTEGNAACREDFKNSNGVAALTGLLRFPEQWNWTPAVGTLKNVAQGERPMTDALLAEGAVPVLVDLLTFGRPILQVGAADTLGSMGAASKEAKTAIHEAGGADKLKELCSAASVASATVKKAAKRALADMGTVKQSRNKDPVMIRAATKVINFKLRLLGMQKIPE
ncbi:hypothetical protein WJX75_001832 [Coccomyxa subellipsoidea]|uniref:ARM repeat-containing protein n=1 Tax=Coccomyxa subellipsoidea TaxID=248742 RepID=A0ABR2YAZ6_9CHLO